MTQERVGQILQIDEVIAEVQHASSELQACGREQAEVVISGLPLLIVSRSRFRIV